MRILIAFEESGKVRDAFRAMGHDAVSCDFQDSRTPGPHIKGNVLDHLYDGWDAMIAFPPCTHLCVSGARWFKDKYPEQEAALKLVLTLMKCNIPRIAIENPVGIISTRIRKPDQIIHPWQFGHDETKTTHLWLKGFPPLQATKIIQTERFNRVHNISPGKDRGKIRSVTYDGIAQAMAKQWTEEN